MSLTRRPAFRVACDVFLAISVIVIYIVISIVVKPTVRGFFCDDQTISYPYQSDTVSPWMLASFTLLVVPGLITLVESCTTSRRLRSVYHTPATRRTSAGGDDGVSSGLSGGFSAVSRSDEVGSRSFMSTCCRSTTWSAATVYGLFMFGQAVTLLVTEIGKLTIGRLRPHFLAVCRPDFNAINCSQGYIEHYNCSPLVHPRLVWEARKSFPSGHSSMAVFMAIFLGYYFRRRLATSCSLLVKLIIDIVLCSLATFCCLSRVLDHKHHWSDVLGGAVVGLVVGVWMVMFMRTSIRWNYVRPSSNGDDVRRAINAPKPYAQPCVVYNDNET